MSDSKTSTITEFKKTVNMSPQELERWLKTEDSHRVGYKKTKGDESVGHKSGRQIAAILRKNPDQYTDRDIKHMRKVINYIHRHLAQRPDRDVTETRWRYSLMNWGHDPMKIDWGFLEKKN